ncbi:MAG TPA: V-type ATP synthase subunit D [Streptosporangiaceae bacterium]|jgi:V/A-type H+/Na+-transporting ATPase subunit D|nr:V-type ATP synthase subunit D [Streptosporangiaceae bacterium]
MKPPKLSVPPGRAGRIWLVRRLDTARRGADLLDRKLRILQGELARLQAAAAETAGQWDQCEADARTWLLRAAMLGGERAIRLADDGQVADVQVSYATTMGIRYPATAACTIPPTLTWDSPVLVRARQAHRAALEAAARHAAASAAARVVNDEVRATRYRLRAVQDRWIPGLEQALAKATFTIEELERADAARLRLATGKR